MTGSGPRSLVVIPFACFETWKLIECKNTLDPVSRTQLKFWKYSRLQNYSSTCDNTYDFSLVLIAKFYHLMLVISNIKPKDHDLTSIYFIKLHYV